MADNSVLLHKIEPKIRKALSDHKIVGELEKAIGRYLDNNVDKLTTSGPVYRTTFLDSEFSHFYSMLNLNPEEIKGIIKESAYIKGKWQIMNNPFNATSALCIRHFLMTKNPRMVKGMTIYLTLSMYPSLHTKYFKYEPNPAIMDYTISNLSHKFKVKNTATIYEALTETSELCVNTYKSNLIKGTDKDLTDFIMAFKTRLNALLKNIAVLFYENEKKGCYLNQESEEQTEDSFRTTENDTLVVEQISSSVVMKLSTEGPNMKLISLAAKGVSISVNELRNAATNLCLDTNNRDEIKKLVSAIVYLFIFEGHKTKQAIGTNDFFFFSENVYRQANTQNRNVMLIKALLDKWLTKYSAHYRKTNRVNTLMDFRKSMYRFFVFTIQQSVK